MTVTTGGPVQVPLRRARVSSLAEEQLRRQIARGMWQPGDRLPSERRLSEDLRLSRASIREAIRGLEATGLVEVRHGQGVFVRQADEFEAVPFASWGARYPYSIGELLGFRLLIEPEVAALAAIRADPAALLELERLYTEMRQESTLGTLARLVALDTALHDTIAAAAGNRLYLDLLDQVALALADSRRVSLGVPGRPAQVAEDHAAIVTGIREGDPRRAWEAMRTHLLHFARDMQVEPFNWSPTR